MHGLATGGLMWRHVIERLSGTTRCIAIDLPAHGASPARRDMSPTALAEALADLCDSLGLGQVDLVANDTGGAIAQIFAARHPDKIRTLTLTNCDVHDNFPPEAFKPFMDMARAGEFGPVIAAMADDHDLARSMALSTGYVHPEELHDDVIDSYLAPFVADAGNPWSVSGSPASRVGLVPRSWASRFETR